MQLYMIGRLKSICKFKEKQVADALAPKKSICNREHQASADTSATRKVNPSSLPLFQSRYITKQEKTMQSSELESGLPDEAEQESIVFFFLGSYRVLNSKPAVAVILKT